MDERLAERPIAPWFFAGAFASLLFGCLISALYGLHLTSNPLTVSVDERALYLAEPAWVSAAFGITGLATAVGAALLLMRKKGAEWVLLVALVAVTVWLGGMFLVPALRRLLPAGEIVMALVVAALTWTIFWFARHSRQRGWLR